MLSKLWRLIRSTPPMPPQQEADKDDLSWLNPPANLHDCAAWDQFWHNHIKHRIGPELLDTFCDDSDLIKIMNEQGTSRILCAGNGISQEPKALAAAGMKVVALDLSPLAVGVAESYPFPPEAISQYYEPGLQKPGGKVEFVTGDILDSTICPGPYDVIIERLTAQNYYTHGIGTIMNALAQRLSEDRIFFSHCHDGAWRPPAERRHYPGKWFREAGWTIWSGRPGPKPAGRVAWLFTSTG